MTRDELIGQLTATFGKTKVNRLTKIVRDQAFNLHHLLDLTFHQDKTVAFRAAWLWENVLLINPEVFTRNGLSARNIPGCAISKLPKALCQDALAWWYSCYTNLREKITGWIERGKEKHLEQAVIMLCRNIILSNYMDFSASGMTAHFLTDLTLARRLAAILCT